MGAEAIRGGYAVKADCPDCRAVSVFDCRVQGTELGFILVDHPHRFAERDFARVNWRILKCSGCGRAGLAKFHDNGNQLSAVLESFHPRSRTIAPLPQGVPDGVVKEYREAELCASVGAWRGASALVRSALEKALKNNGYTDGLLYKKINDAAADGVITEARKQKAHDDIRVLGNEVVHDDWRAVSEAEVDSSLKYAQRVLEDLYDDRQTVEAILKVKNRLRAGGPPAT